MTYHDIYPNFKTIETSTMIQQSTSGARQHRVKWAYFLGISVWILTMAFSGNPPNGRTGAPGESTCAGCHGQTNPPQDGTLNVNFPTTITANQTYALTVTVTNPNGLADRAGFQMTILNSNDQIAGAMSNPSSSSVVTPANNREYHEHNPAVDFPGDNTLTWTVDWTAPAGPDMDQITYYAASIVANGMNGNQGDLQVLSSGSGTLMADPADLMIEITGSTNVTCFGEADGTATAAATGGLPPYDYLWSNGETGEMVSELTFGIYTVTVTDQNTETSTASVEITQPDQLLLLNTQVMHVTCPNDDDGQIDISVSGGTPPYQYTWSNSSNIEDITNLSGGIYIVTVSDDNGCTLTETFNVIEPPQINLVIDEFNEILCFGEENASVLVSASGGTGDFTYTWSNGGTGTSQADLPPGNYVVTATDDNNCVQNLPVFIDEPAELIIETSIVDDAFCFGQNTGGIEVTAFGGTGPLEITWSNGETGPIILNLLAGTYIATVTDQNLCTSTLSVDVSEPTEVQATVLSSSNVSCFGANDGSISINVEGGTPDYIVDWSNGAIGTTIDGLQPGTYTAMIQDVNVCMDEISVTITGPDSLGTSIIATDESGPGTADGSASVTPTGGTPGYSYEWSNGSTDSLILNLIAGVYSVTVTDQNGCTATDSVMIESAGCALSTSINSSNISCNGSSDGSAEVIISGANEPISILWSNGDTTTSVANLGPGNYMVMVTDASNCQSQSSVQIAEPGPITLSCSTMVSTGGADGFIECIAMGGVSPYSYLWSTGDTTTAISNLFPGSYTLTVTDASGCSVVESYQIDTSQCLIEYEFTTQDAACFGESNGEVSVNLISGAISPVTYQWSSGGTSSIETGLFAGTYIVTITDAAACVVIDSVDVSQPDEIMIAIDTVINVNGETGGSIEITVTGGVPPYEYSWSSDNMGVSEDEDPSGLPVGEYQVFVLDANGCVAAASGFTIISQTTAVISQKLLKSKVYPNPVKEWLILELDAIQGLKIESIEINKVQGMQAVRINQIESDNSNYRIAVEHLSPGIYLLEIQTDQGVRIEKFIKG